MNIDEKLLSFLDDARIALAAMNTEDRTVEGLVNRVGLLRYAEGTLIGFLSALAITDPVSAQAIAPKIDGFVSEAIAARLLLN